MAVMMHFSESALAPGTLILPGGRSGLHPDIEAVLESTRPAAFPPRRNCVFTAFDGDLRNLAVMCGRPHGYAHEVGIADLCTRSDVHILGGLQQARMAEDMVFKPDAWPEWRHAEDLASLYWGAEPNPFGEPPLWEYLCRRAMVQSLVAVFRHLEMIDEPGMAPCA